MTKQQLREAMLKKRNTLTKVSVEEQSATIVCQIVNSLEYNQSAVIMAYCAMNNEVDLAELIAQAMSCKTVCVPVTNRDGSMIAVALDQNTSWKKGIFHTTEPANHTFIVDPQDIQLAVLPGLAFDVRTGARVGYGKGYYDRFLQTSHCHRMGVCYPFQLQNIVFESHDLLCHSIMTTKGHQYIGESYATN